MTYGLFLHAFKGTIQLPRGCNSEIIKRSRVQRFPAQQPERGLPSPHRFTHRFIRLELEMSNTETVPPTTSTLAPPTEPGAVIQEEIHVTFGPLSAPAQDTTGPSSSTSVPPCKWVPHLYSPHCVSSCRASAQLSTEQGRSSGSSPLYCSFDHQRA